MLFPHVLAKPSVVTVCMVYNRRDVRAYFPTVVCTLIGVLIITTVDSKKNGIVQSKHPSTVRLDGEPPSQLCCKRKYISLPDNVMPNRLAIESVQNYM